MKKIFTLLVTLIMCLSLCACGNESTNNNTEDLSQYYPSKVEEADSSLSEGQEELRTRVFNYSDDVSGLRNDSIAHFINMAQDKDTDYTFQEAKEMLEYYYPTVTNICTAFQEEDWAEAPDVLKAKKVQEKLDTFYTQIIDETIDEKNISTSLNKLQELDDDLENFWFAIREYWDKLS